MKRPGWRWASLADADRRVHAYQHHDGSDNQQRRRGAGFSLAMAAAESLGVSAWPYVACIMMAASASFATPIGYQTNLMVYGPGSYRFSDFARIGVVLNITLGIVAVAAAPLIWPF